MELFKADVFRRCSKCGKRIQNPKVSMGCAQWCAYARQCLGFDPQAVQMAGSAEISLIDRLVEAVKGELGDDAERVTLSLLVLDRAQDLLRWEEGDPRVVLAAALLHDIGARQAERKHGSSEGRYQEAEGSPIAVRILEEVGMDDATVEHVRRIVGSHHSAGDIDTPEFRIVWDADRLEEAPEGFAHCGAARLRGIIDRVFRTEAGRRQAYRQFVEERATDAGIQADHCD